ncbi:MAG: hypothetical protein V1914_03760 [archaeon]
MHEVYLSIDSKGIIPSDLENWIKYLQRSEDFMYRGLFRQYQNKKIIEDSYSSCLLTDARAPKEAYDFMIGKYDCNLFWVPYYKSEEHGDKSQDSLPDNCAGFCDSLSFSNVKGNYPFIVIYRDINDKHLAVHEMIHAVRCTMNDKSDSSGFKEIMAKEFRRHSITLFLFKVLQSHKEIKKDILESYRSLRDISKAYSRLEDCFESKADYALIRLRQCEISDIASIRRKGVVEYFKKRGPKSLRFEIMCEKLGL